MTRAGVLAIVVGCALFGCAKESAVTFEKDMDHPNGLTLRVPEGFIVDQTALGFRLAEDASVRAPKTILIEKLDIAPAMKDSRQRRLDAGSASYVITELGAGSGGTEYELKAFKKSGSAWISMTASEQAEGAQPEFDTSWAVLDQARLRK